MGSGGNRSTACPWICNVMEATMSDLRDGRGDRRIFVRPVEPGAGEQPHRAAVEARMHAVAVVFDFVQPLIAFRRGVDQLGQLRRDPLRQSGRAAPAR